MAFKVLLTDQNGSVITTQDGTPIGFGAPLTNATIEDFDDSINLLRAILWQYDSAPNILALITAKQAWYDENRRQFWDGWFRDVFDLRTANDFGLFIWSQILDLPLYVNFAVDPLTKPTFGFNQVFYKNFDRGNFSNFSGGSTAGLPIGIKRLALQLRWAQITSSGTVPETNRMLARLFAPWGRVVLQDGRNMTQAYVFYFTIPASLTFLFSKFDILPRPAGVRTKIVDATKKFFGFGPFGLNFNRGTFGV